VIVRSASIALDEHRVTAAQEPNSFWQGLIGLLAETHIGLYSSSSDFVRSISTFLRAARFEHIRNDTEARAFTYSLSAAS
jgi:hypothetical protein